MMRLWVNSYSRSTPFATSATLSTVAHVAIIALWVIATLPSSDVPRNSIANRVVYIPPPDRVPTQRSSAPAVRYVELAPPGPGFGMGPRMMGDARPSTADETKGNQARDSVTAPAEAAALPPGPDSVFSILEVDTAVVRSANSAAPAYPLDLLNAHITGSVSAQYVVDTTGFADTTSFTVLKATNPKFVTAVKEALPYMRFSPAKIGSTKVRQLVEQQFSFHIADTATIAAPVAAKKKP
jgi:periplasmic protein TonB